MDCGSSYSRIDELATRDRNPMAYQKPRTAHMLRAIVHKYGIQKCNCCKAQPPKKEDQASSRCSFHIHDVEHQTKHGCPNEGQGLHRIAIRKQGTSRVTWIADDIPPVLHGILQVSCQIDECSICSRIDTSPLYASSCNVRPRISSRGPR